MSNTTTSIAKIRYCKPLIKHGVCSWTDPSLITCGFYPKGCANNSERLRFYSTHMPCVEVDSSNYAIPPVDRVTKWINVISSFKTQKYFIFLKYNYNTLNSRLKSYFIILLFLKFLLRQMTPKEFIFTFKAFQMFTMQV